MRSFPLPALLVCFASSVLAQSPNEQIQNHLNRAKQHLQEKRPDLALPEFQAVVAIDPTDVEALGNVGVLEFFAGQYAKAVQDLRAALKVQPSLTRLQALLGMSERRVGQIEAARDDLATVFTKIEDQKVRIQVGLELIETDYALRDVAKAAETVNVMRQIAPDDADVLYAAYRIYSDLRDELLLQFAMVGSGSARANQVVAHELARQGNVEGAIKSYRIALKSSPTVSDLHFELAEMLSTQSSAEAKAEAEKEYKVALAADPFDEKSLCRLGNLALKTNKYNDAATYFQHALEIQPGDSDAHFGLGKVMLARHAAKDAELHLEAAAKLDPFDPAIRYRLGACYRELGKQEDARRELAEFQRLKNMKNRLSELYQQMHLVPKDQSDGDGGMGN
jgi:tetratricopeptide (TPR) repeat protein